MTWLDSANRLIAEIDKSLPADADIKARKAALRENAWRLHGGTSWGRKVWSRATRAYLGRFITSDAKVPEKHLSPLERMMRRSGVPLPRTGTGETE